MSGDSAATPLHRLDGARGAVKGLRRRLEYSCPDALAIAGLVALFLFAHRFVDGIDVGGDAIAKWQFVRQWSYANDFKDAHWDHHMARMGVHVVTWVVQKTFGSNWRAYYVAPMFMVALQLPFVYLLAKRFAGRLAGVVAALIVTYLPSVQLTVSQLLPDGFVGAYALIGTYLLVRFKEAGPRGRLPWLLGLSLVAFVGYLAKETFFFFYPGFVVALWLTRRRLRDVAIFLGALLLQLGLETACYATFTKYSSRLAIVRANHFAGSSDEPPSVVTVSGLLAPFKTLDAEWRTLLVVAGLGAAWLLVFNRRRTEQGRAIALVGLSHVALLSISTQMWQRPLPRYMDPALPFAALCASIVSAVFVRRAAVRLTQTPGAIGKALLRARASLQRWPVALGSVFVTLGLAGWLTYRDQVKFPILDGLVHGALMARLANHTYERNLPIVDPRTGKVLAAFYSVYLDDKALARDGALPSFRAAVRRSARTTYLVRDPSVYNRNTFEELYAAGCVIEVQRGPKNKGMKGCADIVGRREPPAECDSRLRELTRPPK
jgi:hypothetical protein